MAYIQGKSIKISIGEQLIGGQQECSLSRETSTTETTTKDSGVWSEEEATGLSWSISCSGLIVVDDLALKALEKAWEDMSTVTIKYGSLTDYKTGTAIIESIEENAPSKDKTTYSVKLKGVGALTKGI